MQDLSLSKKNNGMSFKNAVANTGFYVLLCKVRVMLFPNKYVRAPGNLFQQRRQDRPTSIILKDEIMLGMIEFLVKKYKEEFREIEVKYFGNALLFDHFEKIEQEKSKGNAVMEEELLLTILTREKFFRKEASILIKENKIKQILILGSGLDTFSARKKKYTDRYGVKFFEVDRKEALDLKKTLLIQLGIECNAKYIAKNYLSRDYLDELKSNGFDTHVHTLVVWGGNTMYLTKDQVQDVMRTLKEAFTQSSLYITFDYLHPDAVDINLAKETDLLNGGNLLQKMLEGMQREFGINFKAGFSPQEMISLSDKLGFSLWKNRQITAGDHVKRIGVEQDPVYTEQSYSYATLTTNH